MDRGLAACSLSAAVRPVLGPVDVCKCCNSRNRDLEPDDEINAANFCLACGCGPMCGACTWDIPYLCCRCYERCIRIQICRRLQSETAAAAAAANCTVRAVRRSVYVREVGRIVTLHPAFRAAWGYIARSGVRMPRSWTAGPLDVMLPANRPVWELVHFYQWSLRVLRACAQPDSALYL